LELSPDAFGWLRDSSGVREEVSVLRAHMEEDGYLYLPGFFPRDIIQAAREELLRFLKADGILDPAFPLDEGVVREGVKHDFSPNIAKRCAALKQVVFHPRLLAFYEKLLGGDARAFDFLWLRTVCPGFGTQPHCDIVFMGRGTFNLCTAWIPYGTADLSLGGLMVLEGSHHKGDRLEGYLDHDVDSTCENMSEEERKWKAHDGVLFSNPVELRQRLGGRWLTAEFQPGDLLTFGMGLVHASLDNLSGNRIRLSSDTRYQLASEPVDERWIGDEPAGHGSRSNRKMIC
jgi:hypothetical protein